MSLNAGVVACRKEVSMVERQPIRLHGTVAYGWEADTEIEFSILLDEEAIGTLVAWQGDDGMGVIYGRFIPLPAYERVRPLFRRYTTATRPQVAEDNQEELDRYYAERDAHDFSVWTRQ